MKFSILDQAKAAFSRLRVQACKEVALFVAPSYSAFEQRAVAAVLHYGDALPDVESRESAYAFAKALASPGSPLEEAARAKLKDLTASYTPSQVAAASLRLIPHISLRVPT